MAFRKIMKLQKNIQLKDYTTFKIGGPADFFVEATSIEDVKEALDYAKKSNNLKYYNLINSFYELTGVPIILNTSFNENEPIVNTPEEAINCFHRTDMDLLVIGNYIISR